MCEGFFDASMEGGVLPVESPPCIPQNIFMTRNGSFIAPGAKVRPSP